SDDMELKIKTAIESLKESLLSENYLNIKSAYDLLQEISYKFAESIYGTKKKSSDSRTESEDDRSVLRIKPNTYENESE
ncbi:MAG: hypothetical protein ACRENO_03570, partial [Thermodesulfobacteriota bacterium]